MFRSSLTLGRIAGIRIAVHYTWLFVFLLVTGSLAGGYFPLAYRGWAPASYWAAGVAAALVLFASVLVHELGHSLVALRRGVAVESITLFIFGGVSALEEEASGAGDEFLIAVAGPLTSYALAGGFWGVRGALPPDSPAGAVAGYAATLNLILGTFNLLPGFPLDGGRVLLAAIWAVSRDRLLATRIASYVGQAIGLLLVLGGLAQLLNGGLLNGLWTAFVGWFLNSAAEQTRHAQEFRHSVAGIAVGSMMDARPPVAAPTMGLDEFVSQYVLRQGRRALPVCDGAGRLVGLITASDARRVPREAWPATSVGQAMTRPPLKTAGPRTGLDEALRLLADGDYHQVPVVEDGDRLVGMLSRADVLRFLRRRDQTAARGPAGPPPSAAGL
ncbi:MAG TPA: site-2 protease family protein [Chloroflexota bacterium]|nr:site-2 protease family protein [Chloroflexota bacterium]